MKRKKLSATKSKHPYWKTYNSMQKKIKKANKTLSKDLKQKSIDWKKVKDDSTYLMLLLGECNYLEKECKHCMKKSNRA